MHKEGTAHKAENYMRFTPLCEDGHFWAAKWELRVVRAEHRHKKGTDQWVQPSGNVKLAALWLCGRRHEDMKSGAELSDAWNPRLEANPYHYSHTHDSSVPADAPSASSAFRRQRLS